MSDRLTDHIAVALIDQNSNTSSSAIVEAVRDQSVATVKDLRNADAETLEAATRIIPTIAAAAVRGYHHLGTSPQSAIPAIIRGAIEGAREIGGKDTRAARDSTRAILQEAGRLELPLGPVAVAAVTGAIESGRGDGPGKNGCSAAAVRGVMRAGSDLGPSARRTIREALLASRPMLMEAIDAG